MEQRLLDIVVFLQWGQLLYKYGIRGIKTRTYDCCIKTTKYHLAVLAQEFLPLPKNSHEIL